jgi:hypothetical protein
MENYTETYPVVLASNKKTHASRQPARNIMWEGGVNLATMMFIVPDKIMNNLLKPIVLTLLRMI